MHHGLTHNSGFQIMRRNFLKMTAAFMGIWLAISLNASHLGARDYAAGQLVITHPWVPPVLGQQKIGVLYLIIRNHGAESDRLIGVDLPEGGQAGMHNSLMQDGVMRMRPIDAVLVPAGGEAVLQPGGMHVMLSGLPGPLAEGGKLKLRLRFEKAGTLNLEAAIEKRPAISAAPSPHQGH